MWMEEEQNLFVGETGSYRADKWEIWLITNS